MNSEQFYEAYGLTLRSTIPLPARATSRRSAPDHCIVCGDHRAVTAEAPPGDIVTRWCLTETFGATLTRTPDHYIYRVHGLCDFQIDRDLQRTTVHFMPDRDEALVPLLIASSLIGILLALGGETTLHASAVVIDGRGLAIAGDSGAGKSTLVALLCQQPDVTLVTDDLLRLRPHGKELLCMLGLPDIRLRHAAAELAKEYPEAHTGTTADSRLAIRPGKMAADPAPLHAIVLPRPRHDSRRVQITPLAGARAMVALARCPRVWPWTHENNLHHQFAWFADVARSVPVYEAELPWGPPFDPAIAVALSELVIGAPVLK